MPRTLSTRGPDGARRAPARTLAAAVLALGLASTLAACGQAGSSGTTPPERETGTGTSTSAAGTCDPVAGQQLVVLEDDKKLQTVDNIIPAFNAKATQDDPNLVSLADAVSAALDTSKLIAMNKAVDIDRQTSTEVAQQFVKDEGLAAQDTPGEGKKIVVGAANFSESTTLATVYSEVYKSAGYDSSVQTIGNRETYLPALEKGDLTMVPEYAGTLTEYLNAQINGANPTPLASGDLDKTVTALKDLGAQKGLAFGTPSPAADQNAFAVTKAFADQHQVTTLSELASACGGLKLGGPPECTERPFCEPGLEKTYGLSFASFTPLDAGGPLTKSALQQGKIAIGLVFSSDGSLAPTDDASASPTSSS